MMVELKKSNGLVKSFPVKVAQEALKKAESQKVLEQLHWTLPESSNYRLDKDGLLVTKAGSKKIDG